MTTSYDHIVDAAYHGCTLGALLGAPVEALSGVSAADADHLRSAFGIQTVRDLLMSSFFQRAAAIVEAATLQHDPGPTPEWTTFFAAAPISHYTTHPSDRFRLDFGPVYYRGRLDGSARVLVIGQDPSTNEILAHRVFVGRSGQRVQRVLEKIGLTRSYVMLNAFLFSVFGQFDSQLKDISEEDEIVTYRNAFLDRIASTSRIQAVVTFGKGAQHAFEQWPGGAGFQVFHAMHPAATEMHVITNWNQILPSLHAVVDPDDGGIVDPTPFGSNFTSADLTPIPAFDLPFGLPRWHGQDGGHSSRDGNKKIVWQAP